MVRCVKCNQEIKSWAWYGTRGVMCDNCCDDSANDTRLLSPNVPGLARMPEPTQEELLRSRRGLFEAAIELWGVEAQQKMVVEELLECALELHRAICGRRPWNNDAMIEEIADAKIMLAQLDLMVDGDAVTRAMRFKLDRLAQRLNSAANEEGGF